MPARKVKVDISDNQGNKFTVTFEGKVTRQKILQLFDMIEILGGVEQSSEIPGFFPNQSKFDKVSKIIQDHYPTEWISSKEIQSTYYEIYGEWPENRFIIGPYKSGEVVEFHLLWYFYDTYTVKVRARDIYYSWSDWASIDVAVPKCKQIESLFDNFFEIHHIFYRLLSPFI